MGFLSSLFGVKDRTPATTTNVVSTKLPEELAPFVKEVLGEAQDLYKGEIERGYDPYTGQTIAPLTDEEQQAMSGIAGLTGTTQPLIQEALDTYRKGGDEFTAETAEKFMSPYQQAVTDIQLREAQRKFEGDTLPRLEAQAVGAGAMSGLGSRAGVEMAEAQRSQNQLLADIQARGSQAAFQDARQAFEAQQGRERQMAGDIGRTAPALFQAGLAEAGALQTVGQQKRELGQLGLDEAYQRYLMERNFPKQTLADYSNTIYGSAPSFGTGAGTTTGTKMPGAPSMGQQLLGLGLTGLNIYGAGTAGGQPFSAQRAIGNITGYKKEGGQVSGGLSDLPVVKAQAGTGQRTLGGFGPVKNFSRQKLFDLSPTERYQGPLTISKQIEETLSSKDPQDDFEFGLGETIDVTKDTFDANLADQTGATSSDKPQTKAKKNYYKETMDELNKLKTEYGVKPIDIDSERKSQQAVSQAIATEQERFEGEEAKMAADLLEKNKKALAEGNDAQVFSNNMKAIKGAMDSPTLATSIIDALSGAGEGTAKLEQDNKKATMELDKEFQKERKEARGRKSKNLLDRISRDEGIRTRLQKLPRKQMTEFISDLKNVATIKEAFAKLEAAERKAESGSTDLLLKLRKDMRDERRLLLDQAKALYGNEGIMKAATNPRALETLRKRFGLSAQETAILIAEAQDPDAGASSMGSSSDAASGVREKQKAPGIK